MSETLQPDVDNRPRLLQPDSQDLGCTDPIKIALAARVCEDQRKNARVTNLETHFDADLDLLYVRGMRGGVSIAFVPVLSCQDLDLTQVQEIQDKLAPKSGSVTLAICDTSSNVLYYQLTQGFVEQRH